MYSLKKKNRIKRYSSNNNKQQQQLKQILDANITYILGGYINVLQTFIQWLILDIEFIQEFGIHCKKKQSIFSLRLYCNVENNDEIADTLYLLEYVPYPLNCVGSVAPLWVYRVLAHDGRDSPH